MTTATATRAADDARAPRGTALTGVWTLVGFMLRRDRIRIPAWLLGLMVLTIATLSSLSTLYASEADRQAIASTMDSPAGVAMTGINHGAADYHYGAMMGHQMLWFTAVLVALMSVLLLVRHTRVEEAAGRAELIRAGVVGRHATTAAALLVVGAANLVLAVLLAVGLGATGLEGVTWSGSLLYGAAHAAVGLVFMGLAAVTVQITEHSRGASGMAIGAVGLAYALRAVGDVSSPVLSWLSPIGWAQATQVYVTNRWWPLLPAVATTVVLVAVAVAMSNRRDVGSGLRQPRPGPATASQVLSSPVGFAFRLHRATFFGWTAGLLLLGVSYGSVLGDAEEMLTGIDALEDFFPEAAGVSVPESFAAMIITVMAVVSAIYAVLAALKMRSEETAGRAEPVLATGLSQPRWMASHLIVALLGSAAVLLAAGLGIGLTAAASLGDAGLLGRLLGAAAAYIPAVWVVVGVAVLLFGVLPRAVLAAWALVLYSFITVYLGGILQLPGWMMNLSPFGHVPQMPVEPFRIVPLLVLAVLAAALLAAGVVGFRRRDLQSST